MTFEYRSGYGRSLAPRNFPGLCAGRDYKPSKTLVPFRDLDWKGFPIPPSCKLHNLFHPQANSWQKGLAKFLKGKEPSREELLNCLLMDSNCPGTFEEFCSEFGYAEDSRKAERTFKACQEQELKFRRLMGRSFDALRDEVEALEL